MYDLIFNELRRFRKWLTITALINLVFIGIGIYFDDYEKSGTAVGMAYSLLYGLNALLLGWQQMKTYRNSNMWTYLLNRPVHAHNICLALCAAGALVLLLSLVVPYVVLTWVVDLMGWYIIDQRHYWQALYLLFMSLGAYLMACYITLAPHKAAYGALVLPLLLLASVLFSGPILMTSVVTMIWLLLLLLTVFQANLNSPQRTFMQTVILLLPFHLGAFLVLSAGVLFFSQTYLILVDGAGVRVSWNHYFGDHTYERQSYADPKEQLLAALETAEESAYLRRQVRHSEVQAMYASIGHLPLAQQLPYLQNYAQMSVPDEPLGLVWTYSHDAQAFVARFDHNISQTTVAIEPDNNDAKHISAMTFQTVPVVMGTQLFTAQQLFAYDPDLQQLDMRFEVPDQETILSPWQQQGQHQLLLTTSALYWFDAVEVRNSKGIIKPLLRLPLSQPYENLSHLVVTELVDRYLVSFLYGKQGEAGHYPASQVTEQLNPDYSHSRLVERPLVYGFAAWYRLRGYYLSPLVHVFYQSTLSRWLSAQAPQPIQAWTMPVIPTSVWALVAGLMIISVLLAVVVLRRKVISTTARNWQLLITALTGVCGLLFCWLFYARKTHLNHQAIKETQHEK